MLLLSRFRVVGHSMEPTILSDHVVLVSSLPFLFFLPRVGDLVMCKAGLSDKIFVKRITKQKGGKYFLEGDNAHDSIDSRQLGWIQKEQILGKVVFSL